MADGEEGLTIALNKQDQYFDGFMHRAAIRLARAILLSLAGEDPGPDCKGALEDAARAVELRPGSVQGRVNRANVLTFSARYARDTGKDIRSIFILAQKDLARGLEEDGMHVTALHNRGIIHFYLANLDKKVGIDPEKNYNRAIEDFRAASGLDPSYAYIFPQSVLPCRGCLREGCRTWSRWY